MAKKHKLTHKGWIRKNVNQTGNEYVFWRYADYVAARETKGYKNNQEYISNSELQALAINPNFASQQDVDLISQYFTYVKDLVSTDINQIQDDIYRDFVIAFQQNVQEMIFSLLDNWIINKRKTVTNSSYAGVELDIQNLKVKLQGSTAQALATLPTLKTSDNYKDSGNVLALVNSLQEFLKDVYLPPNYNQFILDQANFKKIQTLSKKLDTILNKTHELPTNKGGSRKKFNDLIKAVTQIIYSEHLINQINGDLLELLPATLMKTAEQEENNIKNIGMKYVEKFINATASRTGRQGVSNVYKNTNFSTNFHGSNKPINTSNGSYYKVTTNSVQNKTDVTIQILKKDYFVSLKNLSNSASQVSLATNTNLFTLLRDYPRFLEHFLNLYTLRKKENAYVPPGNPDMSPLNELRTAAVRATRILMLNTSLRGGTRLQNEKGQYINVPLTDYLVIYQSGKDTNGSFYVIPMANLISKMIQRAEKLFDTDDWRSQPVILTVNDKEIKTKVDMYNEMTKHLISEYKDSKDTPPNFLNARQRSAEVFLKTKEINMKVALRMSQIRRYAQYQW